jgi:hypothetical protein
MQLPLNVEDWPEVWRDLFEERAGILEFEAHMQRLYAEELAQTDIRRQAAKIKENKPQ